MKRVNVTADATVYSYPKVTTMISNKDKQKKRRLELTPEELEEFVDEIVGDGPDEGIFGILDNTIERADREAKAFKAARSQKPKKAVLRKPNVLPKMAINKPRLPEEAEGVDVANVISVPEHMLKRIAKSVDTNTAEMNNLLLASLIPLMLSYDTGTNYAKAAMRDGLNIEIDFDEGLGEAVKHIGYLNVLNFFIKKSRLPISIKKRFMETFADKLAERTLNALVEVNKINDRQKIAQELQAVVYSKNQKKSTVHSVNDKAVDQEAPTRPVASVKRRSMR